MPDDIRFAAYPSAIVYDSPWGGKPVQHLLWGDRLKLKGPPQGDWLHVRARSTDGWMHRDSIQMNRILEVVFVGIGQGAGSLRYVSKH